MASFEQYRDNVDRITLPGKILYLVGTAHVSKASADLTEEIIREVKPENVAIELCEARFRSLQDPDRWKNTDIVEVIRSGRVYVLMAQLMIATFQKKLGKQLKIKPGAEMMRAAEVAEQLHIPLTMADRDIKVTLKRTWNRLTFKTTVKVVWSMFAGMLTTQKIKEEEIERLKSQDAIEALMTEFSEALPEVRETLIDERDRYMAAKIVKASGQTIVAVVGAGHVAGIKRYLEQEIDLHALEAIPPKRWTSRIAAWVLPCVVVGLIIYGFMTAGAGKGAMMIEEWALITSISAGLGALLALAHPLTILAAALSAPFTAIHPLIASGWVAGMVEAMLRKPTVADFETIADDVDSIAGLWRNRLSRILLVVILTNLLGAAGAVWGWWVLARLV